MGQTGPQSGTPHFGSQYTGTAASACDVVGFVVPILGRHLKDETDITEPARGKTNNVVFEQVRHKPSCTSTEKC